MVNSQILEQTKLDVSKKSRSNIFNWRGQFTPQFIEYMLDAFTTPGSLVVDPFCGSGTVLLEAASKQISSIGCEINPAAYAMSKFIGFSNLSTYKRKYLFQNVQEKIFSLANYYKDIPAFVISDDYRGKYKNLLDFASRLFSIMEGKRELLLALIIMMRAENNNSGSLESSLHKSCLSVREDLYNLPFTEKRIDVELCDARKIHEKCYSSADLIITSPPYINVFNYHQNYRALLELIGFDILKVAESEIGSNRKNRGNRFRTVIQYSIDMEQCLVSFGMTLKNGGSLILIVGHESNVRGIPFSNSGILRDIANQLGCFDFNGERHRIFINRFGKSIREDILIMKFTGNEPTKGKARQISEEYLKEALNRAEGDPRNNIISALSDINKISSSPIFPEEDLFNATNTT